jgi:TonB family protein
VPSVVEPAAEVKTAAPQEARLAVLQATAEQAAEAAPRRAPVDEPSPVESGGGCEEEIVGVAPSPAETGRSYGRFWVAAAGLAFAALVAMAFWLVPLARVPQLALAPAPVPKAPPLAQEVKPAAPAQRAPLPAREAVGHRLARAAAASPVAPAAPETVSDAAPLPQIVEAPRSGFIYPVTPNPNLVGKVVLKAVVGSDGSVKQVAVLSGDRALAAAAVRAVRQWRYAPAEVDGHSVEAEAHVTISFLGDDAISIILPQPR